MSQRLGTAVLGCGGFVARHAEILAKLEEINLVAFCNRSRAKVEDFNQRFADAKAGVYEDHHEMFERAELDLVYICLPPFAHSDQVMEAARHGVDVFIEKPIALDSRQGWRMVEAVETAGVKSQVGFMWRFGEAIERLKSALDNGEAGPPSIMLGRFFCNGLFAWWWRDRNKSGGQVVEQAIHLFDLMRHLLGERRIVFARFANLFHCDVPDYTAEDVSSSLVSFANGALGKIVATNTAYRHGAVVDYRVVTKNITTDFQDSNHATFLPTNRAWSSSLTIASQKDVYLAETTDLLQAIREDRPTRIPMREGAHSLDLVLAAARSAAGGREVTLPPEAPAVGL